MMGFAQTAAQERQRLEDENWRLRSRVRELERLLFSEWVPPDWMALPRCEIVVLQTLLKHQRVSSEMMWTALYGERRSAPQDKVHESHVSKVRKKLATYGIEISSKRFLGYAMSEEDKAKLLALSETASAQ